METVGVKSEFWDKTADCGTAPVNISSWREQPIVKDEEKPTSASVKKEEDITGADDVIVPEHNDPLVKDVIAGITQSFLDEGVDPSILKKLEALWVSKIKAGEEKAAAAAAHNEAKQKIRAKSKSKSKSSKDMTPSSTTPRHVVTACRRTTRNSGGLGVHTSPEQSSITDQETDPGLVPEKGTDLGLDSGLEPEKSKGGERKTRKKKSHKKFVMTLDCLEKIKGPFPLVKLPKLKGKALELISKSMKIQQVDGPADSSDDEDEEEKEDEDDDDDDDSDDDINPDGEEEDEGAEEEPLGSEDDISDEDATEIFETDNVVVCQYDKISRTRNKWKFNLKDGIMNLNGKDYVFSRAHGEAEW